jgi:hypothetical protein
MDRLWVVARVELHLTDDEFLSLSYRQFDLLHQRCLTLRWQNQYQLGSIAAAIYQCGMRTFDPMPTRDDFIFTVVPGQKKRQVLSTLPMTEAKHLQIANLFRSIAVEKT